MAALAAVTFDFNDTLLTRWIFPIYVTMQQEVRVMVRLWTWRVGLGATGLLCLAALALHLATFVIPSGSELYSVHTRVWLQPLPMYLISWLALDIAGRELTAADLPAYSLFLAGPVAIALLLAGALAWIWSRLTSRLRPRNAQGLGLAVPWVVTLFTLLLGAPPAMAGIFMHALPAVEDGVYLLRSATVLGVVLVLVILVFNRRRLPEGAPA